MINGISKMINMTETVPLRVGQKSTSFNQVLQKSLSMPAILDQMFQEAGSKCQVSPALLKAIACAESNFDPQAVSGSGAIGIMQLMPDTARGLGVDPHDPGQNIMGGASYIRSLLDQFGGSLPLAIAAYNAGPSAIQKYEGIPPYKETEEYVKRVTGLLARYGGEQGVTGGSEQPLPAAATRYIKGSDEKGMANLWTIWIQKELFNALSSLDQPGNP